MSESTAAATVLEPLGVTELQLLLTRLALPSPEVDDDARIDRLRVLERIKNAVCATQAAEAVAFEASQLAAQEAAGVPAHRRGRGIADQIALARMESPHKGSRLLGLAKTLNGGELPTCAAALTLGEISEWRVTCIARESAHLDPEDRRALDAELAPRLPEMGDRAAAGAARAIAQRLDPAGAAERARRAETERRVSIRPAPDAMTYVSALLPMRDGVSVYAALTRLATEELADPDRPPTDTRGKGQIMADTLIERITGHPVGAVPIRLHLVMTDTALAGTGPGCDTPAMVPGHGTIPARTARSWMRTLLNSPVIAFDDAVKLNRLFTIPDTRDLVAMESTKRGYTGLLRTMLELRDQTCRTPWCDAPIRHVDHVHRHEDGGATSYHNGRGLCARCNHAREAPGWNATMTSGPGETHQVTTTTPTGHEYSGTAPPLNPGREPPGQAAGRERAGPHHTRTG